MVNKECEMYDNILLFEPKNVDDLYPFSILHLACELRYGVFKIYEKYEKLFPQAKLLFTGDENKVKSFCQRYGYTNSPQTGGKTLCLAGNLIPKKELLELIVANSDSDCIFTHNGQIVAIYRESYESVFKPIDLSSNSETRIVGIEDCMVVNYLWDTFDILPTMIEEDSQLLGEQFELFKLNKFIGVHCLNEERVIIANNVDLAPGVVLDARHGKIILDSDVKVMPNAVIVGPCYVGKNTTIKIGAKIYENCAFGEYCKIGGEVEGAIFHSYSNKQHDGFLGHSYICEWVNLGADTNNSDLKNTYSEIVMRLPHKRISTGKMFIGLMAGDHTKSAINSQFTTGTVAGICCNFFDSGFLASTITSFTWGGSKNSSKLHRYEDAIQTATIAMKRRNKSMNEFEESLIRLEFERIVQNSKE